MVPDEVPETTRLEHELRALIDRRRYAQARDVAARALRDHPDHLPLQYFSAVIDHALGDCPAAMRGTQGILSKDPEHFGARWLLGQLHEDLDQFAAAEAVWIDLLTEYPEDAALYAAYAHLMLRTLNLDKAERLAAEGLRFEPEHPDCLYVAAMADVIQGRTAGGRGSPIATLLENYPERRNSAIALIATLEDRGDSRGAQRLAQQLLRDQPDSPELVELARGFKLQNHWSLWPLYPMQRWGWAGAGVLTLAGLVAVRMADAYLSEAASTAVLVAWLAYVVYSWVWPSLLRRFI